MKYLIQILVGCSVVAFVFGVVIRIANTGYILGADAVGWWRASMWSLTMGILYTLIEIRNELGKRE